MKKASLFAVTAALVLVHSAQADTLSLTFAQPSQGISAPSILSYTGTISAAGNSDSIYLNGDGFSLDGPYVLDDSPFLGAPQVLTPGESYTGVLFDVPISVLSEGNFNGTFSLLGGSDASNQDVLVTEPFSVFVSLAPPTAVTPEPSSFLLLFTGAAIFGWCGLWANERCGKQFTLSGRSSCTALHSRLAHPR